MAKFSKVKSASVLGINAYVVDVECNLARGRVPRYVTVGLPEGAVKESKERVLTAIRNTGYKYPGNKIVVNLAPADIKKEGTAFDLPIAVGILAAAGYVDRDRLSDYVLLGELSLDGRCRKVKGVISIAISIKNSDIKGIILSQENAREAAVVEGLDVIPVNGLEEAVKFLNSEIDPNPVKVDQKKLFNQNALYKSNFAEVKGQENVKRSMEVAAAGAHNALMIGPPGSGKTMLARRIPTILPRLTLDEALETTKIHSVSGNLNSKRGIIATRPFRSPHHTISDAALIGGGRIPKPGEVSLSHNGVLFLDELPEFKKNVLEVMRQPLEDGDVTISRAKSTLSYPATFMLIAAMNPCPCGYATDPNNHCSCTPSQIQRYISKISGPLLDRIDIHIEVPAVDFKELSSKKPGEKSKYIRARVEKARQIQQKRFQNEKGLYANAHMDNRLIKKYCKIDDSGSKLLNTALEKLGLSARAYNKILKVSRTIADLAGETKIKNEHLSEAIQYRSLDRQLWIYD
ncbi:MAG: YifB family Mg chelatase-like AAA ATPase [Candidatus Marinimicrobia bacterium]|nr:YifB family Mg chelatase-like AAA ATPase [Candidatus Neomarinimicrobiota bacterium]